MGQPVVFKEDSEILPIGWDYDPETVASATITISPSGLDKEGGEVISGSEVKQTVKNGVVGEFYKIVFEVMTDGGHEYVDVIFVSVYST